MRTPADSMTDALWARYRGEGNSDARARLLDGYLGLVRHCARELVRRGIGAMEYEELVSAGTVGLIQALEGFDPGRRLAFSTYAMPRIRGAMLDELRTRDWLPRGVRARSRKIAHATSQLQHQLGRAPEAHEIAARLEVDEDTLRRWVQEAHGGELVPLEALESEDDIEGRAADAITGRGGRDPHDVLAEREALERLRDSFAALPQKDRLVLTLSYYEELTLRQIGEVLHITESRVSQIRTRALRRLRDSIHALAGKSGEAA